MSGVLKQLRCFAFTQNSPLSAVHGRTADNAGSRFRLILLTRFLFIQDFLAFCVNLLPAPLSRRIRVPHFPAIKNISSYFCLEPRTSLSVLKSLSPLAFLQRDGTDTRNTVKKYHRRIFDTLRINLCAATKGIPLQPALLKIGDADARSVQKTPAGLLKSVLPCTLFNDKFF